MQAVPLRDSRAILTDRSALRKQLGDDGYLFLPGLVPADAAAEVCDAILRICRDHGWVDEAGRSADCPHFVSAPEWFDVYDPLQRLEAFHALPHQPAIAAAVEAIVQEPVLVHPRHVARITFPGAEFFTTKPHQDYIYIRGTHETYTAWMPLCDCPLDLGGLAVLAGSHRLPVLPTHPAPGPGGRAVETEALDLPWHAGDMRAGDVLLFHSHTVHRALPNVSAGRVRISLDARYQGVSQPVAADSLLPHHGRLTWEEVYAGWTSTRYRYYWRDLPLRVVEGETPA